MCFLAFIPGKGGEQKGGGGCRTIGIAIHLFWWILFGRNSHLEKRGDNQKKKFFTSNSVEVLVPLMKNI